MCISIGVECPGNSSCTTPPGYSEKNGYRPPVSLGVNFVLALRAINKMEEKGESEGVKV